MGQIYCFRHGQTGYTDVFPDLTEEGIRTIKKTTTLLPFINGGRNITIFTSPKIRAVGSADIVVKELGVKQGFEKMRILSAIEIKDQEKARKLFAEASQGGAQALSIAYGTDPRFEDGVIVESRSAVKKRFFSFFSDLAKWLTANMSSPLYIIVVSHYELLYHLVETAFNLDYRVDAPLGYGEIIMINVYDCGVRNTITLEIHFRKRTAEMLFDYKKKEIV